ncbi:MAG: hypothetical protein M3170_00550 [Candidatus Dormibacteraeota bacterium]|nr:hypothetical protein [Candidatus Dormibacteraeota bacterium]
MKALKLAATLLSTLVLATIGATSAEAATPHGTVVSGFEFYATSTQGRFSGTATGQVPNGVSGAWAIVVDHTSLDPCFSKDLGTPCAFVTGGSFSLAETSPAVQLITGQFDNLSEVPATQTNQIQLLEGSAVKCTDQHFKIKDGLRNVGTGSQRSSEGSYFEGDLWHHQKSFWGRCITYAATVQGTVVLTF